MVTTTKDSYEFGNMAAAEAARRGFLQASKKAVLGDGGVWIWTIAALRFVGFVPILDIIHLVSYLCRAAQAAFANETSAVGGL